MVAPYAIGSNSSASAVNTVVISVGTLQVGSGATGSALHDAVVVYASINSATNSVTSVADSRSNTYTVVSAATNLTDYPGSIFVALNATALVSGTDTITVTYSSSAADGKIACAIGCSGVLTSGAVDAAASSINSGSTALTVNTGTLAQASELVIGAASYGAAGGTIAWTSPMNSLIPAFECTGNQYGAMSTTLTSSTSAVVVAGTITSAKNAILTISLKLNAPAITTTSLPSGTTGVTYGQTVTATGGTTPYAWSVSSGSLPAGLSIASSTGSVTGTPTAAGTSSFTVEVTDANSYTATKALSITIASSSPPSGSPILQPPSGYGLFGAYPGAGNTDPTVYEANVLGGTRQLAAWSRYYEITQANVPSADDAALVAAGRIAVLSFQTSYAVPPATGGILYSAVTAGTYDVQLTAIASAIAALDTPAFFVWAHEMELSANSGYGTAGEFIASFQHVANLLRANAPGKVVMCWGCSSGTSAAATFYPGDSYVDWICVDPYDPEGHKGSALATYTPFATWIAGQSFGAGKPLGIFETGAYGQAPSDSNTATWIEGVPSAMQSLGYQLFQWFNSGGTSGESTVLGTSSTPLSNAAMAAIGQEAFFNPPAFVPPSSPYAIASGSSNAASATLVLSVSETTNAGDGVVVGTAINTTSAGLATGVTDTQGNTYTRQTPTEIVAYSQAMFVATSTTALVAGTDTITVTFASSGAIGKSAAACGVPGASAVDTAGGADAQSTAGSTAPSVTTGTLAQADECVVAWENNAVAGGAISWGTGFTQVLPAFEALGTNQWSGMATNVTSSTSAVTAAGTITSAKWAIMTAALKITSTPFITTSSLPEGITGTTYSQTVTETGGVAPFTWSVTAGSLPTGYTIGSSTGTISGTASATGTSSFTVEVADANSNTNSRALSIVVASNLVITTTSLSGGTTGVAYGASLAATGGTTPYAWSVSSGSLPAGLSIAAATGVISGTVEAAGTTSFTVEVTDAGSVTATMPLSITITSNLAVSTSTLPNGTKAVAYSTTLAASGGTAPYTWSLLSGSLPASLSLSSGGVISGTPTGTGGSSFTVEVTDAGSNTATRLLAITILGGVVTGTWTGSYSRTPTAYEPGPPPLSPLAIPVTNIEGNWLFAVASWRQDAGTAGVLQYPSTVNISDDAQNFWIPVQSVAPQAGIVRSAIWMAPAARQAEFVFASPTGYQSAITVLIMEVQALCPWYQIAAVASTYTNQGTSITLSQDPPSGLFTLGCIAFDNTSATVSTTASGWSVATGVETYNGTDHSGDLEQLTWYDQTTGSTMTISGSSATTMDWSEVIITVHGVEDVLPFPYATALENWPVLITELAAGAVLNTDPIFAHGVTYWTASGATGAAVTWPLFSPWPSYQPVLSGSVSVTPTGSSTDAILRSELEAVSPVTQYTCTAWVYSPLGYSSLLANINWYTSGSSLISNTTGTAVTVPPGTWTELTFASPVFPPPTAAYGTAGVHEQAPSGDVPSSAVYYVGYCGFGPADAYEDIPPDETVWTDFSARNFTQESIKISRGIQYEQQSLEAGTMSLTLSNSDGAMTFGNIDSAYWPTIGDTDVPVRLRAVWPLSVTPYYVLFSGFTDDIDYEWDTATRYGYMVVEASDAWSRLTSQLLGAAEQEVLYDSPGDYWTCNGSGANLATGAPTMIITAVSPFGTGGASASFGSDVISLAGDQGASCWQSTGIPISGDQAGYQGIGLTFFAPSGSPLPPVAGGVTVEFWFSPQSVSAAQPATLLTVAACWSRKGPAWRINLDNDTGGSGQMTITVFDKNTGAGTTADVGSLNFLGTGGAAGTYLVAVTFTQTSLTCTVNPGGTADFATATLSANINATIIGLSFGGNAGPVYSATSDGTLGFMNIAIYGVAVTAGILSAARQAAHFQTAYQGYPSQLDTARLALVTGYAGATPVILGMRCLDLPPSPGADVDPVTAVTDTSGQVVSDYFTNIASSTFAAMFVNGPGTLIYRRRLEWYNRAAGQWAFGEKAAVPLNSNTLSESPSVFPWTGADGATLTSGSATVSPVFNPWCGVFHGDGSTANPYITITPADTAVSPATYYAFSCLLYTPAAWGDGASTGVTASIQWYTSGLSSISTTTTNLTATAAGSLTYLSIPAQQAPATAAFVRLRINVTGTPASSVLFYAAVASLTSVGTTTTAVGGIAPEVPYLVGVKLSSDRALLFNQAILTQYGTSVNTTYSGTSLVFTPTSGVVVITENAASVAQRAGVPYTATLYLNNTAQSAPYALDEVSIEDFGNWITQTLAAPLLRPETVTITPAATAQAMLTALQAEVGDTTTFRKRPMGAPEIRQRAYLSKLTHDIDIASARWNTSYELSPFPQGTVLVCDDALHGTLTGGNLIGM
jgi:hypothetical protein